MKQVSQWPVRELSGRWHCLTQTMNANLNISPEDKATGFWLLFLAILIILI